MKKIKFAPISALAALLAASPIFFGTAIGAQYYSIVNGSNATVNEWSNCRKVTNATGQQIFVPTNTSTEWSQFLAHYPSGITLSACFTGKRIFATSTKYIGWDLDSDAIADGFCAARASAAGLPGTYKAFLYLGTRMPDTVLAAGTSFSTPNSVLIANDKTDFFTDDGGGNYIRNPIVYNEFGTANTAGEYVWTAFKPTGGGAYSVVPNTIPYSWAPCDGYKINTCERHKTADSGSGCGEYDYNFQHKNWSYAGVNNVINNQWAGKEIAWFTWTCSSCYWNIEATLDTCLKNSYSIYCVQQ
jgi:hypothetical protein